MGFKRFRSCLCFLCGIGCITLFNQQSSAGTWTDAFEDENTRGWEVINTRNEDAKWWINRGEVVCETFKPNTPSILVTGEIAWRNYSFSCKAKLVKAKGEPATVGIILHHEWEEFAFYVLRILYPWKLVHITKMGEEGTRTLGEFDFAAKLDTWYDLTASIDSRGKIKFQIDNTMFTAVDRDPIKNGKAGLMVVRAQARFDDVEITGTNIPNGGPGTLPVELNGKLAITWGELKYQ